MENVSIWWCHHVVKPRHHNIDITLTPWHLKSLETQLYVQQLVQATSKAHTSASHHWAFFEGNPLVTGGFPHKRPVMWKTSLCLYHYSDIAMIAMASQMTGISAVCLAICSSAHQEKHQSSTSLAFVQGIHRGPVNSLHKWPVTW